MPTCKRCGKSMNAVQGFFNFNDPTGRCNKCEDEVEKVLKVFRTEFLKACSDSLLTPEEWKVLKNPVFEAKIEMQEAVTFIRNDALHFLERHLTFISADGILTPEEEKYFRDVQQIFYLPPQQLKPINDRFDYLKRLSEIRQGKLPQFKPSVHLESNECCYLDTDATFVKENKSSVTHIPGELIATNKQIVFVSQAGGWNIQWKNLMRIDLIHHGVYLELATKKGNGLYLVPNPDFVEAVLTAVTRVQKRQLLIAEGEEETRRVPHDIKIGVWQRDQGKCVQCGATSYLEFDHIIPFSKGGATSLNNLQLLCRKCNLEKGDKL